MGPPAWAAAIRAAGLRVGIRGGGTRRKHVFQGSIPPKFTPSRDDYYSYALMQASWACLDPPSAFVTP